MNLIFTNIVLWPFLFLVTVPLILHLFARSRPPAYKFSSVEFILRIIRSTMRVKRPQDWILLLIRTLLFAALVFLFLRPLFFSKRSFAGLFQRKNVVLIIDSTASMSYADGAQTRFSAACAEASEILSGLSARDTANIVWLDSSPHAVFPEMGANIGYLQTELRKARVTSEAGNIGNAIAAAADMLEGIEGRHEVCILSDFQRTAWENIDFALPASIDSANLRIGRETAVNAAITDLYHMPGTPLVNEEVTIYCEVHNYSSQPVRKRLFLRVHDTRSSHELMIPAWGKAIATFRHVFSDAGLFPIAVGLEEDPFPADDHRWSVIEVQPFLQVGLLAGDSPEAKIWLRALDAVGWARTDLITLADLADGIPRDVLMLPGWDGTHRDAVQRQLANGCTVVCSPAQATPIADLLPPGSRIEGDTSVARLERGRDSHRIRIVSPEDAVLKLFARGEYGDPAQSQFRERFSYPPSAVSAGETIIAYDDQVPALTRFAQQGQFYLWNLSMDTQFSDFSGRTEFLPFFGELLLTSRTRRDMAFTDHLPGESITWRSESIIPMKDVNAVGRGGSPVAIREHRRGSSIIFSSQSAQAPGLYTWNYRGNVSGYSAVNFPVIESDLRTLSTDEIEKSGSVVVTRGNRVKDMRDGVSLWPQLLGLCVILVVTEGLFLLWVEKT